MRVEMTDPTIPVTIWLFGLPGAGKTTLAGLLKADFDRSNRRAHVLDGDDLRSGLNRDLGYDRESRTENIRRAAEVALILRRAGIVPICAFITPEARHRALVRDMLGEDYVIPVYLPTRLATCVERDPKGLYAR